MRWIRDIGTALRQLGAITSVALVAIVATTTAVVLPDGARPDRRAAESHDGGRSPAPHLRPPHRRPPRVSLERLVGQRLVVRMRGLRAEPRLLRRVRSGRVGGVILFADNVRDVPQVRALVASLQRAARTGGGPPLLIAVDQEGGQIRRFRRLPPVPSATAMGRLYEPAVTLRIVGLETGRALRRAGVNVDLAPVADVAHVAGGFLGDRTFGARAAPVADAACAFATGLVQTGVAPTLKHFPGLGYAPSSTDSRPVDVTASTRRLRADLAAYRRCGSSGLVMVSSARYPGLLGDQPAVLSPRVYRRELPALGVRAVTISDDLSAPALAQEADVPVRAARAGLDLLLFARDPVAADGAFAALRDAARQGRLARRTLLQPYRRIVALKRRLEPALYHPIDRKVER